MTRPNRADALVAAAQTLDLLAIDQSHPVDPFEAIARLGLELVIARLDNLLGAVLPQGNGGVLITSERPIGVQRYTAAHEIGHWVLHSDELRLDREGDVFGSPSTERERQAQLFAAYFLMPPPLMEAAVARHGLHHGRIRPDQVYLVSRDVDVSYEAAIRRLVTMKLIDSAHAATLIKVGRLNALKGAFDGHRPIDGNAEMWSVDATADRVTLPVRQGDDVLVMLPENRTTGWRWLDPSALQQRNVGTARPRPTAPDIHADSGLTSAPRGNPAPRETPMPLDATHGDLLAANNSPLTVVGDEFRIQGDARTGRDLERRRRRLGTRRTARNQVATDTSAVQIGATGQRTLAVHCAEPGEWTFDLQYAHAYDPTATPGPEYHLRLRVEPTPNHAYRLRRLAADLDARLPGDPDDNAVFEVLP